MDLLGSLDGLSSDFGSVDIGGAAVGAQSSDGAAVGAQSSGGAAVGAQSLQLAIVRRDSLHSADSPGSSVSTSSGRARASYQCKFCQRIDGFSKDFLDTAEDVRWTTKPQKPWCHDCWTTHRTVMDLSLIHI